MKQQKWLLVLLSGVVFISCEKQVNITIPQKEPRLVVNGLLGKNELFEMRIGRSRGILDPGNANQPLEEQYAVKNAVPVVYENGIAIDTLKYEPATYNYTTIHNKTVRAGFNYMIRVAAPGYKEVEASSAVPSQSVITELSRIRNSRTNSAGEQQDEITIRLNDPAGERNFYLVQVLAFYFGGNSVNYVYCVSSTDKDLEQTGNNTDPFDPDNCYGGNTLLMRDNNFEGGTKQLTLFVNSGNLTEYNDPSTGRIYRPFVKVLRITEDEFRYIKSNNAYYNSGDNPFAEPVNVYSNVKNGYGIFSLSTQAVDTLR